MYRSIKFFALSLLIVFAVSGEIEPHLKRIEEKPAGHDMPNIDYIYMINLDKRPEKWEMSLNQLEPYGIVPYRFSAVVGWELPVETINDIGVKYEHWMEGGFMATSYKPENNLKPTHEIIETVGQTYFCYCMSRGAIGIVLSHLSVLQDAWDCGYETIWVMEDDIDVLQDPRIISDLISELDSQVGKDNWDILFTDRDTRKKNGEYVPARGMARRPNFNPQDKSQYYIDESISEEFRQIGARFGAYSMIIRRSGIEKILEFYRNYQAFLPYDMDNYLPLGMKMFTVNQDVVASLTDALSDNGRANYLK